MALTKGQTYGRSKADIWSSKAYYKPTLGKLVVRHRGVNRQSDEVLNINRIVAEKKPATECSKKKLMERGKKAPTFNDFKACLSEQLRKVLSEAGYPKTKG